MYENYIFDLYGTLVGIKTDEEKKELWYHVSLFYGYFGANYKAMELKSRYFSIIREEFSKFNLEKNREIQIERVFRQLYEEKGVTVDDNTISFTCRLFRNISTEEIYLYEGVIEFLTWLRDNGKRVYLLSNAQIEFTMPEIVMLGIKDYFHDIFISSEYGYMKPATQYFQALIKKHNLEIDKSIMIGNDPRSDIEGAKQLGMDSLYIHTENSPQEELEIPATYKVMDGDFKKIYQLIIRN